MKLKSLFLLLPATVVWMADPALADAVTFYDTQAAFDAAAQNATLRAAGSVMGRKRNSNPDLVPHIKEKGECLGFNYH